MLLTILLLKKSQYAFLYIPTIACIVEKQLLLIHHVDRKYWNFKNLLEEYAYIWENNDSN